LIEYPFDWEIQQINPFFIHKTYSYSFTLLLYIFAIVSEAPSFCYGLLYYFCLFVPFVTQAVGKTPINEQ